MFLQTTTTYEINSNTKMSLPTPPIAILGAGPAGLMLGRLLELQGIDYIIFEAEATPFVRGYQGGTLDIHVEDGQRALRAAGLYEEFQKLARFDATSVIVDNAGNAIAKHEDEGEGNGRPEIDRKALREMLLRSVPKERVRWGSKVKSVEKNAEGHISIHFENGDVQSDFKLVVGADGAWSKTRNLVSI